MRIGEIQRAVARSDPNGLDVRWDVSGPAAVNRIYADLLEDNESGFDITLGTDGRALRGIRIKPVVEGLMTLEVTAFDVRGRCNSAVAATKITVVR